MIEEWLSSCRTWNWHPLHTSGMKYETKTLDKCWLEFVYKLTLAPRICTQLLPLVAEITIVTCFLLFVFFINREIRTKWEKNVKRTDDCFLWWSEKIKDSIHSVRIGWEVSVMEKKYYSCTSWIYILYYFEKRVVFSLSRSVFFIWHHPER